MAQVAEKMIADALDISRDAKKARKVAHNEEIDELLEAAHRYG